MPSQPSVGTPPASGLATEPSPGRPRATPTRPGARKILGGRAALPLGLIGVVVGSLLAWRDALRAGVFDDAFWHRASGQWMLDHHQVMTTDVYSYTLHGHSWITPEWGYGVILAGAVRALGPVAFWLLSAGVATLTVLCVAARSRLSGAGWLWTGLLCVETGAAITLFLDDRPQVVSYLLLALLLLGLTWARRHRGVLWGTPLLFAFWANVHGSFLLGLVVLLLEVVVATVPVNVGRIRTLEPLPRRPVLLALGGAVVGTFLNPFGPRVYEAALGVTFNSTVRKFIGEWQSPDFHDPTTLAVVVLPVAVTVAFLAMSDRPVIATDLALAALLLVSTLDASRFMPYFAVAWCGLAARTSPIPHEQLRPSVLTWPIALVLGLSMLQGPWVAAGRPAPSVPVQAVAYLQRHPGRVFSTYLWNDYLDWKGIPVFIDGRTEIYTGTPVFGDYLALDGLTTDPDRILSAYHVRYVLWQPGTPLALYLSHDRRWTVVRRTSLSVVFRSTTT